MNNYRRRQIAGGAAVAGGCGFFTVVYGFMWFIAYFCVNYLLKYWADKDIPWYADLVIAFFSAGLLIPATIITFIISLFP
jgi:hypothetical protein